MYKSLSPKGEIEIPPQANLSALSFRPHKKGRACRGTSDNTQNFIKITLFLKNISSVTFIGPRDYRIGFDIQKNSQE